MTETQQSGSLAGQALATWQMVIGDARRDASSGEWIDVVDPGLGQPFARVPQAAEADVDDAVAEARTSFDDLRWRGWSADRRSQVLWRIADLVDRHSAELADLETRNQGMPLSFASAHVLPSVARTFRYYAGAVERIEGRAVDLAGPGTRRFHAYTRREPIGVAGIIVPWNGPLLSLSWKLAPALAAGCSTVVKPAEETPLTALRLAELCLEAGLPPGVLNVVTGVGSRAGAAIAAHPDIDKVSFTGSTEVGRSILQAAQGNMKKLTLELGGKSPVLVFEDADLSAAIPGAATAIFSNAGQICTAGSRLLVHESVIEEVVSGLAVAADAIRLGYRTDESAQIGPLISQRQRQRVDGYVAQGLRDGAEVVTGGAAPEGAGFFYPPTVVTGVHPSMSLVREEIFGPIVAVMPFADEAEAVALANDTPYGLAGSVWTEDIDRAHRVAGLIRAGRVGVNVHASPDVAMPTGGFKQSGWGRELGPDGLEPYLETKSILVAVDA
ncbi:aldehyde dehydrogenase family protein [Nocardioides sp. LHD-245]|uniref:aldehyde dehydrogenase family protein n=1 Tax=Nocardioides sp. LHD-245 TaxID=3051387 RepID=UPI0027E016E0|nr:aldehyde dehydrogenase family protein [Nocardioides sp. LHD-245]